ncbi:arginine decarboxylase [Actinopolyspora alba]|uniref:Arginine decarboxylase n=1 Tax=Actinopolyspora alba TaxID=673379 RepID=A0A1I1XWI3_9ACTN|nr:hypothetical protein [Actinopolyspora alba]SFE11631.1 arginine decarboxylase [Actinopolyspora alba]
MTLTRVLLVAGERLTGFSERIDRLVAELTERSHEVRLRYPISELTSAGRPVVRPPFFDALRDYGRSGAESWHSPAHAGGQAFTRTGVGAEFAEYLGSEVPRTDLSVSVPRFGSLLDSTGPIGDAERTAARVFGADETFFVLNGSSGANRTIMHSCLARGDRALLDRNCHKCVCDGATLTGALPVYLPAQRNGYGLSGPIPPEALRCHAVSGEAAYAVVTNSTYDGICYDTNRVAELLGESVDDLHFDEAWFAHAAFHPIYRDRYAMAAAGKAGAPRVYAAQSTHKMLAALSQSAMIHIGVPEGEAPDGHRFNLTYAMHASTSPSYPMIAGLDVASAMLDGGSGAAMLDEVLDEAIGLRQEVAGYAAESAESGTGWFFGVWQPPAVEVPESGQLVPLHRAPPELLRSEPRCWSLEPGAEWHGFTDLEEDYALLDPCKVTLLSPGCDQWGRFEEAGLPAKIVARCLAERGIVVEKTGHYTLLLLFTLGTTAEKRQRLSRALWDVKLAYDTDAPLSEVLPTLLDEHPERYGGETLRGLAHEMHERLRSHRVPELLERAYTNLPRRPRTPADAHDEIVRRRTAQVPLGRLDGHIAANMVVPVPPGVPILMPGEETGNAEGDFLRYLAALRDFDRAFPGFEHDIHGIERDDSGEYHVDCLLP